MASELSKVDKFTGVTTAGSIDVTGEGNSTTTNLQQGLAKVGQLFRKLMQLVMIALIILLTRMKAQVIIHMVSLLI